MIGGMRRGLESAQGTQGVEAELGVGVTPMGEKLSLGRKLSQGSVKVT